MPNILVIAEHDDGQLKLATLSAAAFASKLAAEIGGTFELLVIGGKVGEIAESLRPYGASAVLVAASTQFAHPLADKYAEVIRECVQQRSASFVVAAASTF